MVKIKDNPLKNVYIVLGIIVIAGGLGIFTSSADVKNTVDTVTAQKIAENDKLDDRKYFDKDAGTILQADMKNLKEDMAEVKVDVKEMSQQMNQQLQLLYKINAKLNHDST